MNLTQELDGFVYVVRDGDTAKIGYTKDLSRRARGRRTDNPREVETLWECEGSKEMERMLHEHFAEYRHRGEWFRYEGAFKAWVEEVAAADRKIIRDGVRRDRARFLLSGKSFDRHTASEMAELEAFMDEMGEDELEAFVQRNKPVLPLPSPPRSDR